jgi:DNA end-binding protein Ku
LANPSSRPLREIAMAARALASVTVSFGMVSIPVKLFSATQSVGGVSFNLLHKTCGSRLKQQYLCAREGVVVERADMVKGYEFTKDQYVTFTPEELKELEEKGTQTVEISEFVPATSIDPIYYDKAYFLGPDKPKACARRARPPSAATPRAASSTSCNCAPCRAAS